MFLYLTFEEIFYTKADWRIRDKFLMNSPIALPGIYFLNLLVHIFLIPKIMKNQKPLDFVKIWQFSSLLVTLRSLYLLYTGFSYYFGRYSHFNYETIKCLMLNESDSAEVELCWQYVITWFIYLVQNFAFSLSKRESPAGTYTLVHHTIFPILVWIIVRYYPGGHVRKYYQIFEGNKINILIKVFSVWAHKRNDRLDMELKSPLECIFL